jgi:putative peptidoglycan lipid II flippase
MKKTAFIIMLLTMLSKILGFSREVFLAYFYGASNISDAFLISWTIPGVIFSLLGIGISTSFIPLYSKVQKNEGIKSSISFMNNVLSLLVCISMLIAILVFLFAPSIVRVFAPGFGDQTYDLAVAFTKISVIGIFFSAFIYIFIGFLQINNNFVVPALVGIPFNLITIIFIALSARINVFLLIIGGAVARISELLFLIPFAKKHEYKFKLKISLDDKYLKEMIFLSLPVIMGVSVNHINVLIDRNIASRISIGGISALNYSSRLNSFVQGIFVMSIATVMYPLISKMATENNMVGLKKTISEAIRSINLLVIPATIGSMVFAEPVVKLLFGRGEFDSQAVIMTSYSLFFYSIGMVGFGLREILSRAFYSVQDTKTPMRNAVLGMILNIILNIILSKFLGIGGLALATSISALFTTSLLFISLRNKIGSFGIKNISISFVKILCASLVMGVIARLSFNSLLSIISQNLALIISIGIGIVVYFAMIYCMRIDDIDIIVSNVRKRLRRSPANV